MSDAAVVVVVVALWLMRMSERWGAIVLIVSARVLARRGKGPVYRRKKSPTVVPTEVCLVWIFDVVLISVLT